MDMDDELKSPGWLRNRPREEKLEQLQLGMPFADAKLEDFKDGGDDSDSLRAYAKGFGTEAVPQPTGMTLVGPMTGSASRMAAALLKHIVTHHRESGRWVPAYRYLDMVLAQSRGGLMEAGYKSDYGLVYVQKRIDVIVLDGLGHERKTQQSPSIMFELLKCRYDLGRYTIVTTSMAYTDVLDRYGRDCADFLQVVNWEVPVAG